MKLILVICFLAAGLMPTFGQSLVKDYDTERLLRQNVKAKKSEILNVAMGLTEEEAKKFWPLQREYENEVAKLNDKAFGLLRSFVDEAGSLGEIQAANITKEGFRLDKDRIALREKCFRRMSKVLSPRIASRFVQLDSLMYSVVAVQIATAASLVE
ncbi:MAG: hypothetical protein JNL98_37810 [Bryobacterales bacterium]|nr:hypothetical protein [Bryobacterales bacterium]